MIFKPINISLVLAAIIATSVAIPSFAGVVTKYFIITPMQGVPEAEVVLSLSRATLPAAKLLKSYTLALKPLLTIRSLLTDSKLVWSIETGNLPPGLSLNPNTGVISGTPLELSSGSRFQLVVDFKKNAAAQSIYIKQFYSLSVKPTDSFEVSQVSLGLGKHACAITTTNGIKCWGANTFGQLGDGSTIDQLTPVNVQGLTGGVASVSTGSSHTCAVTLSGSVKCWGSNSNGQLGNGLFLDSPLPVDVVNLNSGVSSVSAGDSQTCALTSIGGIFCWGNGEQGALGKTIQ
jgi:hypothetical protein